MNTTTLALGTSITRRDHFPGAGYESALALCADGVVRLVRFTNGGHADTYFSVPGYVRVNGKHVTGYVTHSTVEGYDTVTDDNPAILEFRAYTYGKNGHLLPETMRVRVESE